MHYNELVRYGYPLNIAKNYIDLFDDFDHELNIDVSKFENMNDDQLKAIDVLCGRFSKRNQNIFFLRFKELKTGKEIEEITGVCKERSFVIYRRMLKYICSPECLKIIYLGYDKFMETIKTDKSIILSGGLRYLDISNRIITAINKYYDWTIQEIVDEINENGYILFEDMENIGKKSLKILSNELYKYGLISKNKRYK